MKNKVYLLALGICMNVFSQTKLPEQKENYFDFWVGKWDVSWDEGDGKTGRGTNTISETLDGAALLEDFVVLEGAQKGIKGKSISMYVPALKQWKQTWYDTQLNYISLSGEFTEDLRIFKTAPVERKGKKYIFRMVFKDIQKDSFVWDWESSEDDGKNWKLNWQIFYKRANENKLDDLSPRKPDFTNFIGNWNCVVSNLDEDGNWNEGNAKWEWRTILGGKAIQDYWESPTMKGTNIRTYDPKTGNWMNAWVDDQSNTISETWTATTKENGTIVVTDNAKSFEILFYNIKQDSFDWKWDVRQEDGSLKTTVKIRGRRVKT